MAKEVKDIINVQACLNEERLALLTEYDCKEVELQHHHDDEVRLMMQMPPLCLQQRPRTISSPNDMDGHRVWQEQEFARLTREIRAAKLEAQREFQEKERQLVVKWETVAAEQSARLAEMLQEQDQPTEGSAEYWRSRCETMEAVARESHAELQQLRERVAVLDKRRLSTSGRWLYRSCPADHPSALLEYLNQVQPSPDSIMGCVALPTIHLWVRHEGIPSGLHYTLRRQPWKVEEAAALLNQGNVVVLGVTLSGELFYLNIENPVYPIPDLSKPSALMAPLSGFAWEDVTGVIFTEDHLQAEFDLLGKDDEGTIDCQRFLDLHSRLFLSGLVDPDPSIEALLSKYGIRPDGRMNFDEFCLVMLMIAKR